MIEWGDKGAPTIKAALQGYDRVPYRRLSQQQIKILSNAPEPDHASSLAFRCYIDLEFDRPIGLVTGGIPYTAVCMWSDREGLEDDVFTWLWAVIRIVDNARLKREAQERKSNANAKE